METTTKSSDVCPTEDAVQALLENLVDPLLPLKPSRNDVPSKTLRESVAKQVHAVVLLYNYYHRRNHPHLECLSFESFRSLATVLRPALLQHFKDLEQTSLLEKVIVEACSLSMSLHASLDLSSLKKWPIRKVAVLLVDSQKKNCYLQHSSITQGVWSLLEKTIEKEKIGGEDHNEEVMYQKLAFAAIKEATGINHNEIVILEKHLVYSLSEEKTSAHFYIMKCTSQEKFCGEIPVEDALDCMQGPLFEKSFSEWATKPIVEYFHVLPYASLIADWFSRREDIECVIEKEAEAVCDIESTGIAEGEVDVSDIFGKVKKHTASVTNPRPKKKPIPKIQNRNSKGRVNVGKEPNVQLETVFALKAKNADIHMSPCKESYLSGEKGGSEVESDSKDHRERGIKRKKVVVDKPNSILKVNAASASAHHSNPNLEELQSTRLSRGDSEVESDSKDQRERGIKRKKVVVDKPDSILKVNAASSSAHNSNPNLEELQSTLLSRATSLSETALKVLLCKRDKLIFQQRYIEDEIAKCDKSINNIKDDWELRLETILECCNETYPSRILQESSACQSNKRVKLCESLSPTKSLCRKLDNICVENKWVLPNYRVFTSNGGFEAEVRIKETHLDFTIRGEVKSNAEDARESAASCLLSKLHYNTTSSFS